MTTVCFYEQFFHGLFFSEVNFNRHTGEIPIFADLVLEETFVGIHHVLRQIAEKREGGISHRQLCDVLDPDDLILVHGRRCVLDDGQQRVVQLGSGNTALTVLSLGLTAAEAEEQIINGFLQ